MGVRVTVRVVEGVAAVDSEREVDRVPLGLFVLVTDGVCVFEAERVNDAVLDGVEYFDDVNEMVGVSLAVADRDTDFVNDLDFVNERDAVNDTVGEAVGVMLAVEPTDLVAVGVCVTVGVLLLLPDLLAVGVTDVVGLGDADASDVMPISFILLADEADADPA